jgi:hypothetical protein
VASARARKLALAADTFSGRVMAAPVGTRVTPGAALHALLHAIARPAYKRLQGEEFSFASRDRPFAAFPGATDAQAPHPSGCGVSESTSTSSTTSTVYRSESTSTTSTEAIVLVLLVQTSRSLLRSL